MRCCRLQETVRLDKSEREKSDVTQEARAGMGEGEKAKEEKQGREADTEKIEKAGEREGEKRRRDASAPQGSRVTNEIRV